MVTSSAPNRLYWNTVLSVPWQRGSLGDWRDANGVANGSAAYGSSGTLSALGRYSVNVTALVQRWMGNGLNRGFYLITANNAFPYIFAGRTAANVADRPKLVVVSSTGTYSLDARCNASFNSSTVNVVSSSAAFELRAGQQPAILQFPLDSVTGTVLTATLEFTLTAQTQNTALVRVFEADPPVLIDPSSNPNPQLGLASGKTFAQLATHPAVVFAQDGSTPGALDQVGGPGWPRAPERIVDPARGTTWARTYIEAGQQSGADFRLNTTKGTGPQGMPDIVRDEMYMRYLWRMDSTFGGFADRVKIPALGGQFGYWVSVGSGYWQPTTGNGGSPGTGLKVFNAAQGKWEYQGHSTRLVVGYRCSDASAYADYMRVAVYAYNLDQKGPFPDEEVMPNLVLRRDTDYAVEVRLRQNTMSGPLDANGNYAVANADGVIEVWFNGFKAFSRNTYRWRFHPEIGVQGPWIDVYHGGVAKSDRRMHFRVNEVVAATSYVGP
jgi:hypothetical protein